MKVQGVSRDTLPWKAPFQPYAAWFGFVGSTVITFVAGFSVFLKGNWSTADFISSYIGIPIFIVPIIGWKLYHRTKVCLLPYQDIDGQVANMNSLFAPTRSTCGQAVFTSQSTSLKSRSQKTSASASASGSHDLGAPGLDRRLLPQRRSTRRDECVIS